ncbi:MAG: hypothetical protein A4E27_01691 [Methanobacterium sp. PtaU1.Bin242]|nr:MAG: hypothetical protein A4E27_01691 [Methanobacterium sp. PtaU1.Bin242]
MNKEEYLKKLTKLIYKLPKEDRQDILSDYEEHFMIGLEKGRTEEEISMALGDPKTVAKQIKAEYMVKKAEDKPSASSITRAIMAAAGLGIFNLLFFVLPTVVLTMVILALFVLGGAMVFGGILIILSSIFQPFYHNVQILTNDGGILSSLGGLAGGIGLAILGSVLLVGMTYVARWFYGLIIRYLKLNLKIIQEQKMV